jgi:hypothetical protein
VALLERIKIQVESYPKYVELPDGQRKLQLPMVFKTYPKQKEPFQVKLFKTYGSFN